MSRRPEPIPVYDYAYLLGVYLGDGHLVRHPRAWRLFVTQDSRYQGVIGEISLAIGKVVPQSKVHVRLRATHCVDVTAYSTAWPVLFPQHGPGRKHERAIRLAPWQRAIVGFAPRSFIRGLIHSDGCRIIARQKHPRGFYEYPRYAFSNRSEDIKLLFTDQLDRLGIAWNRPSDLMIQISRREAVAALDEFVGPKL